MIRHRKLLYLLLRHNGKWLADLGKKENLVSNVLPKKLIDIGLVEKKVVGIGQGPK